MIIENPKLSLHGAHNLACFLCDTTKKDDHHWVCKFPGCVTMEATQDRDLAYTHAMIEGHVWLEYVRMSLTQTVGEIW